MSVYTGEKPPEEKVEHVSRESEHEVPVRRKRPPRVGAILTGTFISLGMLSNIGELGDWSDPDKASQNVFLIFFLICGIFLIWLGVRGGFGKR